MYKYLCQLILTFFSSLAFAQSDNILYEPSGGDIEGGTGIKFSVNGYVSHVDNYLYSNEFAKSTSILKVRPAGEFQIEHERHLVKLVADTSYTKVVEFSEDNHYEYDTDLAYYYKVTPNSSVSIKADLDKSFVYRGTSYSLGSGELLESGDERETIGALVGFDFGSNSSTARINASLGTEDSKFLTNRATTASYDVKKQFFDLGLDYSISGKTYASTELEVSKNKFQNDSIRNDTRYSALVGVKWETSEITKIAVLGGYQRITFDDNTASAGSTNKWKIKLDWTPVQFTNVSLQSGRDFKDADRSGELFKQVDEHFLNVSRSLNYRLFVGARAGFRFVESFSDVTSLNEDYTFASIGLKYKWRRAVEFFCSYDFQKLKSNTETKMYDRNGVEMGFKVVI